MKKPRNKTAHGCLQLLALPLALAFVITTIPLVLMSGTLVTFASPVGVKASIDLDEFVRVFMVQAIEQDIRLKHAAQNLPPPQVDSSALRHAVDLLVPPDWVDNAVNKGIDNIFNFLKEGRTDPYEFDFRPLLENFRSEAGRQAMDIIVKHYPPCAPSYVPTFEYKERNVEIECLPSDVPVSQTADQVYTTLIAGFNNDPDILANGGVYRAAEWPPTAATDAHYLIRAFQMLDMLWLLWLLPLGLLAIIALLTVRSLYSLGIWVGSPLLITGVITPVMGLIIFAQVAEWTHYLLGGLGTSEELLGQLANDLVINAVNSLQVIWLFSILLQAGVMILLGVGGLALALLLKLLPGLLRNRTLWG